MKPKELTCKLRELMETLSALPAPREDDSTEGTYVPENETPATNGQNEMLDQIRLRLKYLVFDLEATRRENRYLREMLERRTNFGDGGDQF